MTEKEICKRLHVTPAGLRILAKAVAYSVSKGGKGRAAGGGIAAIKLVRDGLLTGGWCDMAGKWSPYMVTLAGLELVAKARRLGW